MRAVRRVVTAQVNGLGMITADGPTPEINGPRGAVVHEVWRAPCPTGEEPEGTEWTRNPPEGGSVFRVIDFPPGDPSHEPRMHATMTIDYGIVLEGELHLLTDNGDEVKLEEGDIVVQRQATHAWVNRSDRPCRLAAILIDGVQ